MSSLIKKPSAWIPIVIPLLFFAYIVVVLATFGFLQEEKDEGIAAHLFQLWLLAEPLMLAFFAVKWLPRMRREALLVLALQIVAAFLPIYLVFSLNL